MNLLMTKKKLVARRDIYLNNIVSSLQDATVELTPGVYFLDHPIVLGVGVDIVGTDENCFIHPLEDFQPFIFSGNNTILNVIVPTTQNLDIVDADGYEFDYEINAVINNEGFMIKGLAVNDYKFQKVDDYSIPDQNIYDEEKMPEPNLTFASEEQIVDVKQSSVSEKSDIHTLLQKIPVRIDSILYFHILYIAKMFKIYSDIDYG
jgi:hypothetical protein